MKKFYFDTETTGVNPGVNDIIQLAGIIEIDGDIKEKFTFEMQPFNYDNINQGALDTHGITIEKMKTFMNPKEAYSKLIDIFDIYINKFDREDKFIVCGYNVRFDIDFLNSFFKKNSDNFLFSYIGTVKDPFPVFGYLKSLEKIKTEDLKLGTMCKYFGISLDNAHDALADIEATKMLIEKLDKELIFNPVLTPNN
jgi:DNA polymerase-3 subunit epsilon